MSTHQQIVGEHTALKYCGHDKYITAQKIPKLLNEGTH
jgi:hypothetical protein